MWSNPIKVEGGKLKEKRGKTFTTSFVNNSDKTEWIFLIFTF